jgi:hypothetical protein
MPIMYEAGAIQEKALRVLRAAVLDARNEPGVHVSRAQVMQEAGISDLGEFVRIAEYLAERGFIDEGVNDYEFFVVTLEGIAAGARY